MDFRVYLSHHTEPAKIIHCKDLCQITLLPRIERFEIRNIAGNIIPQHFISPTHTMILIGLFLILSLVWLSRRGHLPSYNLLTGWIPCWMSFFSLWSIELKEWKDPSIHLRSQPSESVYLSRLLLNICSAACTRSVKFNMYHINFSFFRSFIQYGTDAETW